MQLGIAPDVEGPTAGMEMGDMYMQHAESDESSGVYATSLGVEGQGNQDWAKSI